MCVNRIFIEWPTCGTIKNILKDDEIWNHRVHGEILCVPCGYVFTILNMSKGGQLWEKRKKI
jgi:hypothetical protein